MRRNFKTASICFFVCLLIFVLGTLSFAEQEKGETHQKAKMGTMNMKDAMSQMDSMMAKCSQMMKPMMGKKMRADSSSMMNMHNLMMSMQNMMKCMKDFMGDMDSAMKNQMMMKDETMKTHMQEMKEYMEHIMEHLPEIMKNMEGMTKRMEQMQSK